MADENFNIDDILAEVDHKRRVAGDNEPKYTGSVTEIIGGSEVDRLLIEEQRAHERAARQRTEREAAARRAREIAAAADRLNRAPAGDRQEQYTARQLTDTEEISRRAADIEAAADQKRYLELLNAAERGESHIYDFERPEVSEDDDDILFHTRGDLVTTDTMQMRKQQRIEEINHALVRLDAEAENPDEMLDQLNPEEYREKAMREVLSAPAPEDTETLQLGQNEIKQLAGGEAPVKEYAPTASRKKRSAADGVLSATPAARQKGLPGELHVGESIVDAIERGDISISGAKADTDTIETFYDTTTEGLDIDLDKFGDTFGFDDTAAIEAVKAADELAQNRRKRLSDVIISDGLDQGMMSLSAEEEPQKDEEEEDENIDLDDENVIRERLNRADKGLVGRLVILFLLFAAVIFIEIINKIYDPIGGTIPAEGTLPHLISRKFNPEYYLYTYLGIGILSFVACSSVISNGFARLVKLHPDVDTLCALSHVGAIIALIPYLSMTEYIQTGKSHVYLAVSLTSLCFNTVSKLCTVKTAQGNFNFTSGDSAKYFIERRDGENAEQLTRGTVSGYPVMASMRKTEMLCDFIVSTYCEDASDRISKFVAPITLAAGILAGVVAFLMGESSFLMNNVSWAATAASAVFALGASFSGSIIVTLPMMSAAHRLNKKSAAILGYSAVEEFSDTNAILVDAKSLFPANTVTLMDVKKHSSHKSASEGKVNIDDALVYCSSLCVAADSVLTDMFYSTLRYQPQMLKKVSGCVYENNLGITGWIDRRRVLLGTREHMKAHEITVPSMKRERTINPNNDEVVYLAVGGEVCMVYIVSLRANIQIKRGIHKLTQNGVKLIVKTIDGMITPTFISDKFDVDPKYIRVIPYEQHAQFAECTKFAPTGSAAMSCDGTFSAYAEAVGASKGLRGRISLGGAIQTGALALGLLLAAIFLLFRNYGMFSMPIIMLYNLITAVITLGAQFFKKI